MSTNRIASSTVHAE